LWERASLFLCVSDFIRRKAIATGFPEKKLRLHYTGIDLDRFAPSQSAPERDRNVVLYVGRLVKYKGADQLVRAMQIVRETNRNARLVVIGDGEYRAHVESLAGELAVPTEFLGEQPSAAVRSWLERAGVFCAPSVTLEDGMSEAFGNVFTEAQAMGLPVVSYRHGGITETMLDGETGLLADEYDYRTLAAHLLRYLSNDEAWQRSHELGMKWVRENFDVRVQTAKLEEIYEEVIASYIPRHIKVTVA
jgi:glycosyltransferase involved in cell wall biosynthesis